MASEWREYVLHELADATPHAMSTGPFGSAISSKYFQDKGVPVIRGGNLSADAGMRMSDDGLVYVSEEKAKEFRRSLVRSGDLIFTCWGTINQIGLITDSLKYSEYVISNKQMKFTPDKRKVDSLFLYYVFSSPTKQAEILQNGIGAAVPGFNLGQLKQHKVLLPGLTAQKSIAGFLGTLDDKIELNRQINTTLEAMAQALFKSWFVDFDPVIDNALAAGNPIPNELAARAERRAQATQQPSPEQPHTLPTHIRQQFPDRFVLTEEMGWVPEGWDVTNLGAITTELRRGISPKYLQEGGVQVLNQKCIRNHAINFELSRRHDVAKKKIDGRELAIGDVLVNSTGVGTLGRMAQIYVLDETTIADSHVTVVRADSDFYRAYTFGRMMLHLEPVVEAMGEGSTGQTELSRLNLQALPVLVPGLNCQDLAEQFLFDQAQKMVAISQENQSLIGLRDTLLPKLLSGQLRIPEAEQLLAETL